MTIKKSVGKFLLLVSDFLAIAIVGLVAFYLVSGTVRDIGFADLLIFDFLYVITLLLSNFYRYKPDSGIPIVKKAFLSICGVTVVILLVNGWISGFTTISERWVVCYAVGAYLWILGSRTFYRITEEHHNSSKNNSLPPAIVYGAGQIGQAMARIYSKGLFQYHVVGFVDDNEDLAGEFVCGIKVYGDSSCLESVLSSENIDTLIIAITKIFPQSVQKAVSIAKKFDVKVKIVPSLFESKGKSEVSVRDIDYSDLLGRDLITIEKEPLFEMFQGKTILVTGAGGSIGSEICTQLMEYGLKKLILLDIDETELHDLALRLLNYQHEWSEEVETVVCDIKNADKLNRVLNRFKPDIIFHAAAYKHVPLMELYPEEAITNNIGGSYNLFKAATVNDVKKVVVISTDKAVNPTNVMGATKRVVEMMAATFNKLSKTDFCCVRFGNVIGSRGSMLPLFLEEIRAGRPITVTDRNIIRYFMAIPEAVSLVFRAATLANGGEVMVLDMGNPVNIYDFAKKLIDIFGDGRSTIKITGLRPGEKLYEELLASKDNTIPTTNEKIFKAKVTDSTFDASQMDSMVSSLSTLTPDQMLQTIKELVPEFNHK